MSKRLTRLLVGLYPRRWRQRYGLELEQLVAELDAERALSRVRLVTGLIASAGVERARAQWLRAACATALVAGAASGTVVNATAAAPRPPKVPSPRIERPAQTSVRCRVPKSCLIEPRRARIEPRGRTP